MGVDHDGVVALDVENPDLEQRSVGCGADEHDQVIIQEHASHGRVEPRAICRRRQHHAFAPAHRSASRQYSLSSGRAVDYGTRAGRAWKEGKPLKVSSFQTIIRMIGYTYDHDLSHSTARCRPR